ncbi:MAG: hypothetical protein U1E76_05275 [Planctomycetota bacterium]
MDNGLSRTDLHRLARVGAQARLEELRQEQAALLRAFPGLVSRHRVARAASAEVTSNVLAPNGKPVRRSKAIWSAAKRKAVSLRMKKYWAARRKEKDVAGKN